MNLLKITRNINIFFTTNESTPALYPFLPDAQAGRQWSHGSFCYHVNFHGAFCKLGGWGTLVSPQPSVHQGCRPQRFFHLYLCLPRLFFFTTVWFWPSHRELIIAGELPTLNSQLLQVLARNAHHFPKISSFREVMGELLP